VELSYREIAINLYLTVSNGAAEKEYSCKGEKRRLRSSADIYRGVVEERRI